MTLETVKKPRCTPVWVTLDTRDFLLAQDPLREQEELQKLRREGFVPAETCPVEGWEVVLI
jgi:hypothetical protein